MTAWLASDAALLLLALLLDRVVGEMPNRVHPVVAMGNVIRLARRFAPTSPAPAFLYGLAMALLLPLAFGAGAWALVRIPLLGPLFALWLLSGSFAVRTLGDAGERVGDAVSRGDLEAAREGLGWLCSRDPTKLGAEELVGAAVESVAENASDSAVAPFFWLLVLGIPGAVAYRCVNTLDAMIGYRGRYEWLGKASARLDDLLNAVPARLTALLLCLAAGRRGGEGLRVALRDRRRTESPNAGWPMAAMAGILGVQLTKPGHYALGDAARPLVGADARRARVVADRAMWGAGLLTAGLLALLC